MKKQFSTICGVLLFSAAITGCASATKYSDFQIDRSLSAGSQEMKDQIYFNDHKRKYDANLELSKPFLIKQDSGSLVLGYHATLSSLESPYIFDTTVNITAEAQISHSEDYAYIHPTKVTGIYYKDISELNLRFARDSLDAAVSNAVLDSQSLRILEENMLQDSIRMALPNTMKKNFESE